MHAVYTRRTNIPISNQYFQGKMVRPSHFSWNICPADQYFCRTKISVTAPTSVQTAADEGSNCLPHYIHRSSQLQPLPRVLRRIPRAFRVQGANNLADILDGVVRCHDNRSWERLFRFGSRCLCVPSRRGGGHRRSLATEVKSFVQR